MLVKPGRIEGALGPARAWMAVYRSDYRAARAGQNAAVIARVQRRLRWHEGVVLSLFALVAAFHLFLLAISALAGAWMFFAQLLISTHLVAGYELRLWRKLHRSNLEARQAVESLLRGSSGSRVPRALATLEA